MSLVIIVFSAFKIASDIIERLGTDHKQAERSILNDLIGSHDHDPIDVSVTWADDEARSFRIPYLKLLPSIIKGDKQGAASEVCQYAKDYINSEEFVASYNEARNSAKPTSEPYRMDAETLAGFKNMLKESEASLAQAKAKGGFSAEQIKMIEEGIEEQRKMIAEQSDPTPNKTKWLQMYPENPAVLVKARLKEYLDLTATVDFNAKLADVNRMKKFVNPAYEAKSLKWKAIYRAGKDVNDVAIVFVQDWLKGEIIASDKIKMSEVYPEPEKNNNSSSTTSKGVVSNNESNDNSEVISEKPLEVKPKNQLLKSVKDKAKKVLD
jgi:hypothetical protein